MAKAIALIRGVNVGATRPLPMALLRELCTEVGFKDAQTYIQSGNVVFRWTGRGLAAAAVKLEEAIEARQGFRPTVVIRTLEELEAAVAANPFAEMAAEEPSKLLVMYLQGEPRAGAGAGVDAVKRTNERLVLIRREVFVEFPDGAGRSKLSLAAVEKAVGVPGTARNWNTTMKLLEIARSLG